jgi:DNA-binding beta-propeller fold protein YncE
VLIKAALATAALAATAALPLKTVATVPLPGGASRLDYASVDPGRHRLYMAHLGGGLVIVFDTKRRRVVKTIRAPGAHGVLAVPSIGRVYASATDVQRLLTIDSRTNRVLASTPAGDYPDGIAYDSKDRRVFVSDESGGREYVFTAFGRGIGSVDLGGEAGNVQYDPATGHVLADVQTQNVVAVINPRTLHVIRRVRLPGCSHDHGLNVDAAHRLAFVACDENARLLTLDLRTMKVTGSTSVGGSPDVLAFDPGLRRLYVAAETGDVAVFAERGRTLKKLGEDLLAPEAHVVAVDPSTHLVYFPLQSGPTLRITRPTR